MADPATAMFTTTEVVTIVLAMGTAVAAHFTAIMAANSRINRANERHGHEMAELEKQVHELDKQVAQYTAVNGSIKQELSKMETRLEENFTKTTQLLIVKNNEELTRSLITQMSKIMDDKLKGTSSIQN